MVGPCRLWMGQGFDGAMTSNTKRFLSVSLRGLAQLSKFAMLVLLARWLEPRDLGLYGLLAVSTGYLLYLVGLEFHSYVARQLIGAPPPQQTLLVRDQYSLYLALYVLVVPFGLLLFQLELLPWSLAMWFFPLLLLEHLAQELNRTLLMLDEQHLASLLLFCRAGGWCLPVIAVMWRFTGARDLDVVLGGWALGVSSACGIGLWRMAQLNRSALAANIHWRWIFRGVRSALPFLASALVIKALFAVDRYWVQALGGLEVLGAYTLFVGIANSLAAFLEAGLVVYAYPKIVGAAKAADKADFHQRMRTFSREVVIATTVLALLVLVSAAPVVGWLGKGVYLDHLYLLKWLLLALTLYSYSMIPHIGLYARGNDRAIIVSHLAGLAVFLAVVAMGGEAVGVLIVPWGLCLSFLCILVWKTVAYLLLGRGAARSAT